MNVLYRILYVAIIVVGIGSLVGFLVYNWISGRVSRKRRHEDDPSYLLGAVRRNLGGSSVAPSETPAHVESSEEPVFQTLRATTPVEVDNKRSRLGIRMVVHNTLDETLVIDDIHVRVYERVLALPSLGCSGYGGDLMLAQDNTLWKDGQSYSVEPGKYLEFTLVFEAFEESTERQEYPVRVVFGLLLDYYLLTSSGIDRRAIPSDCIYLFENWDTFTSIDRASIEDIQGQEAESSEAAQLLLRLAAYLREHLAFRAVPKP